MALATEAEWESDPELRAMRKEFVASFEGRKHALDQVAERIRAAVGELEPAIREAEVIAHKLAGAAETYGFPTLTQAAAGYEGWVARAQGADRSPERAFRYLSLLALMLEEARGTGKDVPHFRTEPVFKELVG